MTLPKNEQPEELSGKTQSKSGENREAVNETFIYKDAGLMERHGYIPYWLKLVVVILLVWGAYYLWAYWTPSS